MKNSLKLLLCILTLGVVAVAPSLRAQEEKAPPAEGGGKKGGKGRGPMTPEQQISRMEEAVGPLTADQKAKITAIMGKTREQMQAIPQEERREKGREIMMASQKDIRAVLTADQQAKFDAMPRGGPGGPGGGKGGKKKDN